MAYRWTVAALVAFLLWVPGASVNAAQGPACNFYDYQSDAQADYERLPPSMPHSLDDDGNGIACDELPQRPETLARAQRFRGDFDRWAAQPMVRGIGYSNRYEAGLSFATFTPPTGFVSDCPELASSETLNEVFALEGFARSYYAVTTDGSDLLPDEGGLTESFSGLVWTVLDDPAHPVLLNEWIIRAGLAYWVPSVFAASEVAAQLESAQAAAQQDQVGVWGGCQTPGSLESGTTAEPEGSIVFEVSSGSQVVRFNVESPGTYQLIADVYGANPPFFAADIRSLAGDWFPELSIVSAEGGTFTSAGYLGAGEYYIQIKAVGSWRVTVVPLGG